MLANVRSGKVDIGLGLVQDDVLVVQDDVLVVERIGLSVGPW